MRMNEYQSLAEETAIYPREFRIIYPALGLAGEAGEVVNKVKKYTMRDQHNPDYKYFGMNDEQLKELENEIGDVLWYVAQLLNDLDILLEGIAIENIDKLTKRKEEGKLKGSGDKR